MEGCLGFRIMVSGVPDASCESLSPCPSASQPCAGGCQKREARLGGDGSSVITLTSLFHVCQWIIPHRLNSEHVSIKIRLPTYSNYAPRCTRTQRHVSRMAGGAGGPVENTAVAEAGAAFPETSLRSSWGSLHTV